MMQTKEGSDRKFLQLSRVGVHWRHYRGDAYCCSDSLGWGGYER